MRNAGFIVVAVCLAVVAAPALAGKKADGFFGPEQLYTIHLRVSQADWELMQPTRRARPAVLLADSIPAPATQPVKKAATTQTTSVPIPHAKDVPVDGEKLAPNNFGFEYVYVKARFECDGQTMSDVAVRFKGNSSYENFQRGLKRPFKVDFDRFVPGRKFHGLATLNLGNNAFDNWQLREALSYAVYRRAGVPAPRTAFAMVYLTVDGKYRRQLLGFYTIVEELDDKSFLTEHFGDAGGLLMKPEGIRGLPYMGENWAAYPQRYHTKTSAVDAGATRRFIDFVKMVNYADDATFKAKIGDYLAVDGFLRYLAATVLITNLDSPLITNHNFYMYENRSDGKVWMMPWDMNLSFASYGGAGGGEAFNLSISHPWAGTNKLFDRVMEIAEYDKAYRAHLRAFVGDFFNEAGMRALAKPMQDALAKAEAQAAAEKQEPVSNAGEGGGRFGGRLGYTLADYVPKRVQSVMAQLDGGRVGTYAPQPVFVPRPNGVAMGMRWGVKAPTDYGNLGMMAQALRRYADEDSDYKLSGREARDAVAALFYNGVSEAEPDSMSLRELTAALSPVVREFAPETARGFLGIKWHGASASASLWASAVFRDADTDRDGRVTLAELTDLVGRQMCLADRDQDGALDEREIIEGLDLLAAPDGGLR